MKKIEGLMLLQREPFAFSKTQKVKYEALKFIYFKILHWLKIPTDLSAAFGFPMLAHNFYRGQNVIFSGNFIL